MPFSNNTQDCQIGLNFSEQQEAEAFRGVVEDKINQRNNRQGQHGCGLHFVIYKI